MFSVSIYPGFFFYERGKTNKLKQFKVNGNKMEVGSLKIKNLVVGKRENKI